MDLGLSIRNLKKNQAERFLVSRYHSSKNQPEVSKNVVSISRVLTVDPTSPSRSYTKAVGLAPPPPPKLFRHNCG